MLSVVDVDTRFYFVPVLFIVVGVGFVFAGFHTVRTSRAFRAIALRAPGVVTDLRYRLFGPPGDGPDGIWFPVLRFETADGRHVDTEAMYGRSPPPARKGDAVMVLYDPADPTRAALDQPGVGVFGVLFGILGAVLAVVGLVIGGVMAFVSLRL